MTDPRGPSRLDPEIAARLKRDAAGLVAAVAQQYDTGEVLMVGWMDDEALHRTLTTGRCTYWSRSRQEYWVKGETSGHAQQVKSVALDCDGDTVLVKVDQAGGACHTGDRTCFDAAAAAGGGGDRVSARPRREYLGALLLGAVGAAVVLIAVRQDWARVLTVQPRPLPASTAVVRGQDLLPAAGALGLAALAGLAALLATRRLARRLVGGAAGRVRRGHHRGAEHAGDRRPGARRGDRGGGAGQFGARREHGRQRHHPGRRGGRDQPGQPRHDGGVPVALGGAGRRGCSIIAAGLLVAWRGAGWPVMSSRYDRPAGRRPSPATDPAALWESLSQGIDPTDAGHGASGRPHPVTPTSMSRIAA